MATKHVVSISGGKDSTATALICLDRHAPENVCLVMADTGNEHPTTLQYIDYLRDRLNMPIEVVRADFTADIARKREYVRRKWPEKGVAPEAVERALGALVPTGNPFLDLCIWKGRFPSRKAQFCTQELKRYPLERHMLALMSQGLAVESWRGVRRDESQQRANRQEREQAAEGWWINHPIVNWSAQQVVDFVVGRGVELNPLYRRGFARVGCAPCINSSKEDIALWAKTFPEVIDRIREWEWCVGQAAKRGASSFLPAPDDGRGARQGRNIDEVVDWAKTSRGGKAYDLFKSGAAPACSSVYGLCE